MTLGELHATTRTILDRARAIGMSVDDVNRLAQGKDL